MKNYTTKRKEYPHASHRIDICKDDRYVLTLYTSTDPSNCKLSYVNSIGSINQFLKKDKLEILNLLLKDLKGSVIFNTVNKKVADFIARNYPTYYYHKVPTGYYGKYQYHLCIKNTVTVNANCREPEKETSLL